MPQKPSINLIVDSKEFKITGEILPNPDALRMLRIFRANNEGDPKRTFAVKFDMDELDSMKDILVKLAQTHGVNGFGFYYAQYPHDDSLNPAGRDYSDRPTIIFVPLVNGKPINELDPENPSPSRPGNPGDAYNHGDLEP